MALQPVPPRLFDDNQKRYLDNLLHSLTGMQSQIQQIIDANYLSQSMATAQFAPSVQTKQLQANGSAPLNVTQLLGVLAQPQVAGAPSVKALPSLSSPTSQDGALVDFNGLLYRFNGSVAPGSWQTIGASAVIIADTHSNRLINYPPANYPVGTLFYETDTTLLYRVSKPFVSNLWVYLYGTYSIVQASLATYAATLTGNDIGVLVCVSDYGHVLQWQGSLSWAWATMITGEMGSDYFVFGAAPTAGTWVTCHGQTQNYLTSTGTIGTRVLPDTTTNAVFIQTSPAYSPTVNAATEPNDSDAGVNVTPSGSTLVALNPHHHHGALPANVTFPLYYRI